MNQNNHTENTHLINTPELNIGDFVENPPYEMAIHILSDLKNSPGTTSKKIDTIFEDEVYFSQMPEIDYNAVPLLNVVDASMIVPEGSLIGRLKNDERDLLLKELFAEATGKTPIDGSKKIIVNGFTQFYDPGDSTYKLSAKNILYFHKNN